MGGAAERVGGLVGALGAGEEGVGGAGGVWRVAVAEAEEWGGRFGGEEPRLGRDAGKGRWARPIAWEHCHEMWIAEPGGRCKISPVW